MSIFDRPSRALNRGEFYDFGNGWILARPQRAEEWELMEVLVR